MAERPFPVADALTRPFWDAVGQGRLDLQRCRACGRFVFYPRALCPFCGEAELGWTATSGRGLVHSFTTVHRAAPGFEAEAPYVVALVDLEEGARMMTRLIGIDPSEAAVGLPVQLSVSGDPPLPTFTRRRS